MRAINSDGVSPWQIATSAPWPVYPYRVPTSTQLAWTTPNSPSAVDVSWLTTRNLKVEGSRGSPVSSYRVQWDTDRRVNEVQQVNVTLPTNLGAVTEGSYQYAINAEPLFECLPFDAPAWRWERALEAVSFIDDVTVSGGSLAGGGGCGGWGGYRS